MNPEVYVYIRIYYVVWGFWGLKVGDQDLY